MKWYYKNDMSLDERYKHEGFQNVNISYACLINKEWQYWIQVWRQYTDKEYFVVYFGPTVGSGHLSKEISPMHGFNGLEEAKIFVEEHAKNLINDLSKMLLNKE